MTIAQSLKLAIIKLTADRLKFPHLEAEILLSKILKKPREFILAHSERKLTKSQIVNYKLLIKKKLKHMPLAYITQEKEFYGLKFKVNKNVLIPRPETELMVEEALKLATRDSQPAALIDVGTGSGCIIIALAKLLKQKSKNKNFIGIDISEKALAVARQNAKLHDFAKNINFFKGDLLKPIINSKLLLLNSNLIILANLPYLTPAQIKNSPTIKYEPSLALSGGKNGLELYKKLFKQINRLINNTKYEMPNTLFMLCEINPGQTVKIKQLIKRELPQSACQIKKDLAGLNRLIIIKII